jgi:hypothetical protein
MNAGSVYRSLLLARGAWLFVEWIVHLFRWSHRIPQHEPLFGAIVSALLLTVLAGLWFFRLWARWAFILLLAPAFAYGATRPYDSFVHPTTVFVAVLSGAIIAMSFLLPVRDMFAKQRPNQALQPTAGRSDV